MLIANFMSNVCLFKRYNNNIYGITGTLEDQTELDMLKKLYNGINTCKILSFRCRKLYELEGLVTFEEKEWVQKVCKVVKKQVSSTLYRGPRAALVICETISCGVTKSLFEKAISCHQENPSSLNHEKMIPALKALLTLKSFASVTSNLDKAKDARNIVVNIRLKFSRRRHSKSYKKGRAFLCLP